MLKVVLVEDEPLVRQGLALAVDWASMGCVVVGEAEDGEEGCRVARKTDPDLILTDVRMPRMDGISMIARLRQEGCRAEFIILTAYSDFEYAHSALKLGVTDYLLKPFEDDSELEAAVEKIRQRLAQRAQPAAGGGLFRFDLVAFLFGGSDSLISRIIYILVGVAAVWCISLLFRDTRAGEHA